MAVSEVGAELITQFCTRCKEVVIPEPLAGEGCCPYCSEPTSEMGDVIDAIHDYYREVV